MTEQHTTATHDAASELLGADVHRVGNLTDDPVLRRGTQRGTPYTTFGLAVDRPVVPGDWSGDRETVFYACGCFDGLARNVAASLRTGDRAVVVGHVELSTSVTDDGDVRARERLVVEAIGPELRWTSAKPA
jgi:single-strand DNA-binding protein